ncbi:MAG: DEAD/DEAH box helicase [Campylobacterales bacterium]|nr:DEAD/DEAH box helicase [Campylobacterales bacterium]
MPFSKYAFNKEIITALKDNNFKEMSEIQKEVIPLVLEGFDIKAQAQTGSGKTAAFVLPILKRLSDDYKKGKPKIKVLVLTPTRELALQVTEVFKIFSANYTKKPEIVTFIGGLSLGDQLEEAQKGCEILISTSGRLVDILSKKQIDLSSVEFLVLDEADKMLDLGFSKDLEIILEELPAKRQNLMFSATYSKRMLTLISTVSSEYKDVVIEVEDFIPSKVVQRVIEVNLENRRLLLKHLLKKNDWPLVIVFVASRIFADNIAEKFRYYGFKADSFHGELSQEDRNYTLKEFKEKRLRILFSTDIAARGIHIDDVTCVINFDLPRSTADYIHRIGRTGRANNDGLAISFIGHEDQDHFALIEKRYDLNIERESIEGFELRGDAIKKEKGKEAVKGKRKSKKDKLREAAALKEKKK